MNPQCPRLSCAQPDSEVPPALKLRRVVREGRFYRRSDHRWIERYFCHLCRRGFSQATGSENYRQRKRAINEDVARLLSSSVNQRRAAILLQVNRKTVVRKFRIMAERARKSQAEYLKDRYAAQPVTRLQWDDLETSEHSKYRPLSVALAVEEKTRKILGFQVSRMPPRGKTAQAARLKYGPRPDQRALGWTKLLASLKPYVSGDAVFETDENPHYRSHLQAHFPDSRHVTYLGAKGSIGGHGELKKIGHDPLFWVNHTCAMLRDNLSRLVRRTWCTTKNIQGLHDHLALYVDFHNRVLTLKPATKGASL